MGIKDFKKIYISGIGGIGVSALAQFFVTMGKTVVGSDCVRSHITKMLEDKGIKIYFSQKQENIKKDFDCHIYSPAVPENNPERIRVNRLGIQSYSYPFILGMMSREMKTIAVSGTKGKTTTTAMISQILEKTKYDPLCIVGSKVNAWQSNFKKGAMNWFVVEACEHKAHMLNLQTEYIVLTNIYEEHLDYYKNIDEIQNAFQKFIDANSQSGKVIYNKDDYYSQKLNLPHNLGVSYSIDANADVRAHDIMNKNGKQMFNVIFRGNDLGRFVLSAPGKYNIYNALAAIALCLCLNVSLTKIKTGIKNFSGTWRRFEHVGKFNGLNVISDYAHHPFAISQVINATKEMFAHKNVFVVFQPHQHNRTKMLYKEFVKAFAESKADKIIITKIFDVPGREEKKDQNVSAKNLALDIGKFKKNTWYAKNFNDAKTLISKYFAKNDVLLVAGAGDIYLLAEELAQNRKGQT